MAEDTEYGHTEQSQSQTQTMDGRGRPSVISISIRDKQALYMAYMPFVVGGGLFVPTTRAFSLGDEVFLLVQLMGENEKNAIAGKVVWITPKGAQGNRPQGVGVQFTGAEHEVLKSRIENQLGASLNSKRPTHTM
jgi:type IV pilus assembly protein PilZ